MAADVAWVALVGVAVATVEHIAALAVRMSSAVKMSLFAKMVVGIVVVAVEGAIEKAFAVAAAVLAAATIADKAATFCVAADSLDGSQRTGDLVVVSVFADVVLDVVAVVAAVVSAAVDAAIAA